MLKLQSFEYNCGKYYFGKNTEITVFILEVIHYSNLQWCNNKLSYYLIPEW